MTQSTSDWYKRVGTAYVVQLPAGNVYHDEMIDVIQEDLTALIVKSGCRRLVLDFAAVAHIASDFVAALIVVKKRIAERGGELTLCGLNPNLRDVFATLHLDRVFTIKDNEQDALADAGVGGTT
jgi:anti-anti-sigma factor